MNTDIRIYVMAPIEPYKEDPYSVRIAEDGEIKPVYTSGEIEYMPEAEPRQKKPTIEELEQLLNNEEEWVEGPTLEILPNGEVRAVSPDGTLVDGKTPLTFREDLGGEYAEAA